MRIPTALFTVALIAFTTAGQASAEVLLDGTTEIGWTDSAGTDWLR